jgi:hypothetical protein
MQKYFDDVCVLDSAGDVVPLLGATITVYDQGTTNISTIYSDNGITPKSNPFTAEDDGSFEFYAADGRYDILATKSPYKPKTVYDILLEETSSGSTAVSVHESTFNHLNISVNTSSISALSVNDSVVTSVAFSSDISVMARDDSVVLSSSTSVVSQLSTVDSSNLSSAISAADSVVTGTEDLYVKRNKQTFDVDYTLTGDYKALV